jgi:eukaryotic-like serine/threonine-protein kinase
MLAGSARRVDVLRSEEVTRVTVSDLLPEDPTGFGPYRLIGRLGDGGMGRVYLAVGPDSRMAAVKTLTVPPEPVALHRMSREVAALQAVTHPRLARLLDHDLAAPAPWLAMQYAAGPALHERALPLTGAALDRFASGLADALAALHAAGIVHRDLKPSNVVLGLDGPVLVDLGIAQHANATALTQVGTVIGSPGWLAPEQLRGLAITPAADVWGWGALVALAATGRPAFGGGDPRGLGWRVLNLEPDLDGVPEPWLPLVTAALRKDPAARPSSVTLARSAGTTRTTGVVPSPRTEPLLLPAVTAPVPLTPARRQGAARPVSRRLGYLAAVLAICAAAGVGGYRWGDARTPPVTRDPSPVVVAPSPSVPAAQPQLAEAQPGADAVRQDNSGRGSGSGGSGHGSGSGSGGSGSGGPGSG